MPRRVPNLLRCPRCAAQLDVGARRSHACRACDARYPLVGGVPILLSDPEEFVTRHWGDIVVALGEEEAGPDELDALRPLLARSRAGEPRAATWENFRGLEIYSARHHDPAVAELLLDADRILTGEARVPLLSRVAEMVSRHADGRDDLVTVDVGASVGGALHAYASFSRLVLGVDISVRAALRASSTMRRREARYTWLVDGRTEVERRVAVPDEADWYYAIADCLHLPIASEAVDVVTCLNTLELVDAPRLLREVTRLLRPGGLLVLATTYSWRTSSPPSDWLDGGVDGSSGDAVRRQLAGLGCELLEEHPSATWLVPVTPRYAQLWIVDLMLARRARR